MKIKKIPFITLLILTVGFSAYAKKHPLCEAAESNSLSNVKAAIQSLTLSTVDINCGHKNTPLHLAAINNNWPMAKFFLSKGANPDALNEGDNKPLDIARANDFKKLIEILEPITQKPEFERLVEEYSTMTLNGVVIGINVLADYHLFRYLYFSYLLKEKQRELSWMESSAILELSAATYYTVHKIYAMMGYDSVVMGAEQLKFCYELMAEMVKMKPLRY